jgi:exopolyphosphatase / guanosine-5'-triphosphate,3'-diphosphate pyrophosphatase
MRLGVLDVGSNTVHLQVVDAHHDAHPMPMTSQKSRPRQLLAVSARMSRATLDGVSSDRARQLIGGALIAEAAMRALALDELDLSPWSLRAGVILRRLDQTNGDDQTATRAVPTAGPEQPDRRTGRDSEHGARWRR